MASGPSNIGEYTINGAAVNPSLVTMPSSSTVWGLAVLGSSLVVPVWDYYQYSQRVDEFDASTGAQLPFTVGYLSEPYFAVVSGNHVFVLYSGGRIAEYDATSGATINGWLANVIFGKYIAASPGPGGTVNLFVTSNKDYSGWGSNTGSIQKITVVPSTGAVTSSSTLVGGLNYPEGIAVSGDGRYVYVVVVASFTDGTFGHIYKYDATTGWPVRVPLVANISGTPFDIALSQEEELLVTLNTGNAIGAYDAVTGLTVNARLITGLNRPRASRVPGGTRFCTPPPSNMVAWYSFDQDLPGGQEYDLAKGNDATRHDANHVLRGSIQCVVVQWNKQLRGGTGQVMA